MTGVKLIAALGIALVAAQLTAREANAQRALYGRANVELEGPLSMALIAASAMLPRVITASARSTDAPTCGACDPAGIALAVDRATIGLDAPLAARVSDWLLYGLVGGALATPLLDRIRHGNNAEMMRDLVVGEQVLALTLALTELAKHVVRRPRPYAYNRAVPLSRRSAYDARLSFFSGHASMSFASATYIAYTVYRRRRLEGDSGGRALGSAANGALLASVLGAATAAAVLRVVSGRHFVSDVVVGALVGAAIGLLIPWAHDGGRDADASVRLSARASRRGALGTRRALLAPLTLAGRF